MAEAYKDGFANTNLEIEPYNRTPEISDDIQQSLSRLLGWDENNKQWITVLADVDGRLKVSSSPTQSEQATNASATVGVASSVLLAANPDRKQYLIQNNGSVAIYLGFGATPVVGTHFMLAAGGTFADDVWIGVVNAISSLAGQSVIVVEM